MSGHSFGELGGEDPYAILGLLPGAGEDEIRAARRRLLRRYHPDLPGGDLQRTQMITAAAYILLDPVRRSAYKDGVSTTSVVGRDVRVEYRTEPLPDPVPPFRPRRPAAAGPPANGPKSAKRSVHVVWQAANAPAEVPVQRGGEAPTGEPAEAVYGSAEPVYGSAEAVYGSAEPALPEAPPEPVVPEPAAARVPEFEPVPGGSPAGSAVSSAVGSAAGSAPASNGAGREWPLRDKLPRPLDLDERPERPPWSALAIVAALATVTCTPVSLLLGAAALWQIRRTGRRGKSLAMFGTLVGGFFLILYMLLVPSTMGSPPMPK